MPRKTVTELLLLWIAAIRPSGGDDFRIWLDDLVRTLRATGNPVRVFFVLFTSNAVAHGVDLDLYLLQCISRCTKSYGTKKMIRMIVCDVKTLDRPFQGFAHSSRLPARKATCIKHQ